MAVQPLAPASPVPSAAPTNKAVAATGGSAFGAAVSTLVLWGMRSGLGWTIPDSVEAAITTIITGLLTLSAAYYTPPGASEAVVQTPDGVRSAKVVAPN